MKTVKNGQSNRREKYTVSFSAPWSFNGARSGLPLLSATHSVALLAISPEDVTFFALKLSKIALQYILQVHDDHPRSFGKHHTTNLSAKRHGKKLLDNARSFHLEEVHFAQLSCMSSPTLLKNVRTFRASSKKKARD